MSWKHSVDQALDELSPYLKKASKEVHKTSKHCSHLAKHGEQHLQKLSSRLHFKEAFYGVLLDHQPQH
jgi:hypothetical protein